MSVSVSRTRLKSLGGLAREGRRGALEFRRRRQDHLLFLLELLRKKNEKKNKIKTTKRRNDMKSLHEKANLSITDPLLLLLLLLGGKAKRELLEGVAAPKTRCLGLRFLGLDCNFLL